MTQATQNLSPEAQPKKNNSFLQGCKCIAFASFFPGIYLIGNLITHL